MIPLPLARLRTIALAAALALSLPAGLLAQPGAVPPRGWLVKTRPHVDLWLHGFAMLSPADSLGVPLFGRGYRDQVIVAKNGANILTALDANADSLRSRYRRTPGLLQAQFLAFRFNSWTELSQAIDLFVRAGGDPRRAPNREAQQLLAELAALFPGAAERDWARLFVQALEDEDRRFHGAWWRRTQGERRAVLASVDSAWTTTWQPALLRFLSRSQLRNGELLLSLPLGGEGRATGGPQGPVMAVPFPETAAAIGSVLYVAAHEAVGTLVGGVVADNTTPAEQRAGVAGRHVSAAQVLGGYELLRRVLPAEADGYARYYLAEAGRQVPAAGGEALRAALAATFPLPPVILEALVRQLEITLGGI